MAGRTNTNLIVKFAVFCVLAILIFAVINIQMQLSELKENRNELKRQIEEVGDTIEEITIRLDTPITDEYIERVARESLGFRRRGEIIFYNDLAN